MVGTLEFQPGSTVVDRVCCDRPYRIPRRVADEDLEPTSIPNDLDVVVPDHLQHAAVSRIVVGVSDQVVAGMHVMHERQ